MREVIDPHSPATPLSKGKYSNAMLGINISRASDKHVNLRELRSATKSLTKFFFGSFESSPAIGLPIFVSCESLMWFHLRWYTFNKNDATSDDNQNLYPLLATTFESFKLITF